MDLGVEGPESGRFFRQTAQQRFIQADFGKSAIATLFPHH
jgi:hypothetical protein